MIVDPVTCPDCSFPPNFIITTLYSKNRGEYCGVQCRDCGDYWEEFPENFKFFKDDDE